MGINCTTSTTNHTSTPIVVAYHTGPLHLAGPTAGLVPPGFPPKFHDTPTVPAGPNPTTPYNYNMMPAQSNVTPTGLPSQPTSITVQPWNVGLTALSGQATTIPHAFTTETLRDFSNGALNMDTDFMTRRVLLQCDSMGNLYPVIHPSPIPRASLVSQHTWHQRLGHPGDGTLSRYKARLVTNGSTQLEGVDVDETFSPVVKPGTIRTILSYAVSRHWPIHHLDVKNAFLHGDLSETVYMHQPPRFRDSKYPDHKKYAIEILEKAHMVNCNSSRTPVDSESKLRVDGDPISDPTLYRSLAGSLQYPIFTRPDISYVVQQVCLYMHDLQEPHFSALKRVLRYVRGILEYGLQLFSSSTTDLVAYSDADLAGCPTTRRSTSSYCVFLGNNLLSWSVKRQPTLSRFSAEAEYHGVANAVAETCWLRNLLLQHQHTKHIEIDIHFIHDLVAAGQVRVLHVPSRYQFADIFTK
nr:ribonuclease H-like domain-containing protein [Tanacetum cinerariifolium]